MTKAPAPRDLVTVIVAMLAVIPESESMLRTRLASVMESAGFTAPEAMSVRWHQAAAALKDELGHMSQPQDRPEWATRVRDIWIGPHAALF